MASGPQAERSMLESKEREELHTIAQSMAIKVTSRTKKADLVDRILAATGVTETASAPTPTAAPAAAPTTAESDAPAASRPAPRQARGPRPKPQAVSSFDPNDPGPSASVDLDDDFPEVTTRPETPTSKTPAVFPEPEIDGAAPAPRDSRQNGDRPERQDRGDRPDRGPRPNNGGNQQGQGNGQGGQRQGGSQPQPGNEIGGRRNRRRRGRDRDGSGFAERDFQGQGNDQTPYNGEVVEVRGTVDLRDEGFGFLRTKGYLASAKDVYVPINLARKFAIRKGDVIEGAYRPAANNEKFAALVRVDTVSGLDPEVAKLRPKFEDLTPLFPDSKLVLETGDARDKENLTARIVDLLAPIGKGQRGLIVSPPKAGKTTVMKQIAHSIEANNPDIHLMVLLVDERPEEVTDMKRSVSGEVIASTFDRPSDEHTQVAELALERAKRLVEMGRDVVIILDGITRLARAYNLSHPATGRIMSGGVDSGSLYPPKKFFGAARNIEEGGSLTILATALVETGSKMDEVIFEEFKGTGNMELRLDRRLAERRLYPSIDVNASSTRHEELLFDRGQLQQVWKLRRVLNALAAEGNSAPGLELLMDKIRTTRSNDEFLAEIAKGPTPTN